MDKRAQSNGIIESCSDIIQTHYSVKSNLTDASVLIKKVCLLFDSIKNDDLSDAQIAFLYEMANAVGLPQYFTMLERYNKRTLEVENISMIQFSASIYEASLLVGDELYLHKYQKEILNQFTIDSDNRFFLTAPTSFGKRLSCMR